MSELLRNREEENSEGEILQPEQQPNIVPSEKNFLSKLDQTITNKIKRLGELRKQVQEIEDAILEENDRNKRHVLATKRTGLKNIIIEREKDLEKIQGTAASNAPRRGGIKKSENEK